MRAATWARPLTVNGACARRRSASVAGCPIGVADPKRGQAVDLRERAEHDDVRAAESQVHRRAVVRSRGVFEVGLVDDDQRSLRHRVDETGHVRTRSDEVPVGLLGLQTKTTVVSLRTAPAMASRSRR